MINFNDNAGCFYAFMRGIAEPHADILHSNKEKHFFIGELEEFFMGLRSKVRFPALVVEGFELNYSDEKPIIKHRESAFTVIYAYTQKDDYNAITDCYSKSEIIGEEIINKIRQEGMDLPCQVRIENIHGLEIINENEKYAGVRFSFTLRKIHTTKINANKWLNQE